MITRRNWLLRCSILINVIVLLYICSNVMIGGDNMALGPSYIIQEEPAVVTKQQAVPPPPPQQLTQSPQLQNQPAEPQVRSMMQIMQDTISNKMQEQPTADKETIAAAIVNDDNDDENSVIQSMLQPKEKDFGEVLEESRFVIPTEQLTQQSQQMTQTQLQQSQSQQHPQSTSKKDEIQFQEVTFINASTNGYTIANDNDMDVDAKVRLLTKCHDREYGPETVQRGDFWVLKNYIRADHGELKCQETITYTTHADYTFLDNLIPLLERWNAPVSIAIHAPGTDFTPTINSIKFLRDCAPENQLVRQFATFHIYFSSKHIPKVVPIHSKVLATPYNCTVAPPFANVSASHLYKTQKKLLYPVNVGRNIARDAAMTHFLLASDIELYPNPGLVRKFLEMIARNDEPLQRKNPRVFPLSIFEVNSSSQVPRDKTELQELLRTEKAIPFHKRVCSSCHGVPKSKEWMAANETEELGVFHIGKRVGYFVHWEPIYIGTHADPHYDERLSWEGKSDKMTQGYALCALDYEFQILDNAFLVHKPGIKVLKKDPKRAMLAAKTNQLIKKIIYPELQVMYGRRKGCGI